MFFDITSNFLEKNIYANLLTRCDDACVITPYLLIYLISRWVFTGTVLVSMPSTEKIMDVKTVSVYTHLFITIKKPLIVAKSMNN